MNWLISGKTYEQPTTYLFLVCDNPDEWSEDDEDAIKYDSAESAEDVINREKFRYLHPRVITDIEASKLSNENFAKRQEWLKENYCPPRR